MPATPLWLRSGVIGATDAGRRRDGRYREKLETNRTWSDATHTDVQKNTENTASDAIIDDRRTKGRERQRDGGERGITAEESWPAPPPAAGV